MTVIIKSLCERKGDMDNLSLVIDNIWNDVLKDVKVENLKKAPPDDESRVFIVRRNGRRVSSGTLSCLFLSALLVMSIGLIGGLYLYKQYARAQVHRFQGFCRIPYELSNARLQNMEAQPQIYYFNDADLSDTKVLTYESMTNSSPDEFFREQFIIENDYEKIDIPDFKDGRHGRFIHDFNTNMTGIIDSDNKRCFVMPLDRETVLPPDSLHDLIQKMWGGYYNVDMTTVKSSMRATLPSITQFDGIGIYITTECMNNPTYLLEKQIGKVTKRSAEMASGAKYAQYAGKGIVELDITNFDELMAYEAKNSMSK